MFANSPTSHVRDFAHTHAFPRVTERCEGRDGCESMATAESSECVVGEECWWLLSREEGLRRVTWEELRWDAVKARRRWSEIKAEQLLSNVVFLCLSANYFATYLLGIDADVWRI